MADVEQNFNFNARLESQVKCVKSLLLSNPESSLYIFFCQYDKYLNPSESGIDYLKNSEIDRIYDFKSEYYHIGFNAYHICGRTKTGYFFEMFYFKIKPFIADYGFTIIFITPHVNLFHTCIASRKTYKKQILEKLVQDGYDVHNIFEQSPSHPPLLSVLCSDVICKAIGSRMKKKCGEGLSTSYKSGFSSILPKKLADKYGYGAFFKKSVKHYKEVLYNVQE